MTTAEDLAATRKECVRFQGDRAGRWPVTLAQGNVFDWTAWDVRSAVFSLYADLPAGRTVADVCTAVCALVSRHEGLRTYYTEDPGGERSQTVAQAGELEVLILELGDQAGQCTQVTEPFRAFDHGSEYPLRVAVALDRGTPLRVIFEFSHLCADLVAGNIVLAEFADLMADTAQQPQHPPAWQPADQAESERTPAAVRRMARTLGYWRTQVSDLPVCLLSVPPHIDGPPDYRLAALRSAAASAALREISARTKASCASIIVSAITTLLSWWTDNRTFAVDVLYSNRSLPHMQDYVGTIAQSALLPFSRTSSSFVETVLATHAALLEAYRFAYFDGTAVAEMVETVGVRRGCERHRDLVINDMSTIGGEAFLHREERQHNDDPADTECASGLKTSTVDPLRLTILRTQPSTLLALSHDVRYVPDAEAVALLSSTERMLTAAAQQDIDIDNLADFLGLNRPRRGEGWQRLNAGWVDVPACERLFRQVTGDNSARVFARDGTLTGYAAPDGQPVSLERLHTLAMASLGGRHGAVTPDRYVICAQAPRSPQSPAAWLTQPVLMAGPGR